MLALIGALLLDDSELVASNFDRIVTMRAARSPQSQDQVVLQLVGTDVKRRKVTTAYTFSAPNDGADVRFVYVLSDGKTAFYRYHIGSRMNDLVAFQVKGHDLWVRNDLTDELFDQLPKKMTAEQVPNNVGVESVHGNLVKLNFESRDERDGIKAAFQVKNGVWKLQSAKYWRDKGWNGVRNF